MASRADQGAASQDRLELLVTVLLVVAAVATSWSSYQATRWHGEQAQATSRTNAIRIDAARSSSLAEAQTEVDVATFIAWADADQSGDASLATFYTERFRPEFTVAFNAWIATEPFTDPKAPETPFTMAEYQVESKNEAARLDDKAEESAAEVRRDIQRASNYVLSVVLYAVVLFFAGISTKFSSRRLRAVMLLSGLAVLVGALIWVATFPVSIGL
ncbi:hypothetical protein [Mycetocola zhadangensis]|uniref:DUF4337 family protein n=1 Tax=Mycetocola zhadangensis TaxID=1164595 RepID=A0A3L7J6S1_9MICO|nr:hypothetical protein [Mycetocola zhadangensis]RLQ86407.1 hypothetical protein D9V28_06215 [Mycetocola zhadangensis]GGE90939.1 hypothetical protein GCM10011313_12280 [Mycetocola zhadangensis]